MGQEVRRQLLESFSVGNIGTAHCWGTGSMVWCTHKVECAVWGKSTKVGNWYHAQSANIGGMGVRVLCASDMPLFRLDEGKEPVLKFRAKSDQKWAPHVGLSTMLDSIRVMSRMVLEHMARPTQGVTAGGEADTAPAVKGRKKRRK